MKNECEHFLPRNKPTFPCGHCPNRRPECTVGCRAFLSARDRLVQAKGGCDACEYLLEGGDCGWRPLSEEIDALATRLARIRVKE
jgi:hypothetical protein